MNYNTPLLPIPAEQTLKKRKTAAQRKAIHIKRRRQKQTKNDYYASQLLMGHEEFLLNRTLMYNTKHFIYLRVIPNRIT